VTPARLARLLGKLTTLRVSSPQTRRLKAQIEHVLMQILRRRGLGAVERAIAALNAGDRRLALAGKHLGGRAWREDLGRRILEIAVTTTRSFRSTSVRYRSNVREQLTPRQRGVERVQQAFYARYMSIGQRAYTDSRHRLAPADRLILLIGELEADVNNGGFDQYLRNKGRGRAGAALSALRAVGARRTARMLEKALAPTTTAAQRTALGVSFYRVPEDLPVLTARHVGLHEPSTAAFRTKRRL
jgi:hypothetical protein